MIEQGISNITGLEARDAALFVQIASKFSSEIKIKLENHIVNAKSIMGIISLGSLEGHELIIVANGDDEEEAIAEIKMFLNSLR